MNEWFDVARLLCNQSISHLSKCIHDHCPFLSAPRVARACLFPADAGAGSILAQPPCSQQDGSSEATESSATAQAAQEARAAANSDGSGNAFLMSCCVSGCPNAARRDAAGAVQSAASCGINTVRLVL